MSHEQTFHDQKDKLGGGSTQDHALFHEFVENNDQVLAEREDKL